MEPRLRERAIRIFISSTFQDLSDERDWLTKRVFPQLRAICDERGVTWQEVDLRWGVTDEQRADGQVLPICFEEITRCRPFFIGILGRRYGWIPETIPESLLAQHEWLAERPDRSVTELEFRHGALQNPSAAPYARFYLRQPERWFRHALGSREQQRLNALIRGVQRSRLPIRKFRSASDLGDLVLSDFTTVIDELFPTAQTLDRAEAEQQAFAHSRLSLFVGREPDLKALGEIGGESRLIAVEGTSGIGKSALIATWSERSRKEQPEVLITSHFVGAGAGSNDWLSMVVRLCSILNARLGASEKAPHDPQVLPTYFRDLLEKAGSQHRVVIAIDALDQLDSRHGGAELAWLPEEIPNGVRFVCSALPGHPLDILHGRGAATFTVRPLTEGDRRELIVQYLRFSGKTLPESLISEIQSSPLSANPLFLRALLEELRLYGRHEGLTDALGRYLSAKSIDDLYEAIFERWELDFDEDATQHVSSTLSLLWAARDGLNELELRTLLSATSDPISSAEFVPLLSAIRGSLIDHQGLLRPGHTHFRRAVQDRYLTGADSIAKVRSRLIEYFAGTPRTDRDIRERPWQLVEAERWLEVQGLLSDPLFFEAAWDEDQTDLMSMWARVAEYDHESPKRLIDAGVMRGASVEAKWQIATFLQYLGHNKEALQLEAEITPEYERRGDRRALAGIAGNSAIAHLDRGDYARAQELFGKQERLAREIDDPAELIRGLTGQGTALLGTDPERSIRLFQEAQQLAQEENYYELFAVALGDEALAWSRLGDHEKALALLTQEERIHRMSGDLIGVARALGNIAARLSDIGNYPEAIREFQRQEELLRRLGRTSHLAQCLGNQAACLPNDPTNLRRQLPLRREQERLARSVDDPQGLARALHGHGALLQRLDQHTEAKKKLEEAVALWRDLEEPDELERSLARLDEVHSALGEKRPNPIQE